MTSHDLKIPGKFAIYVDGLFSKEECQDLIALAERNEFKDALINIGGETQMKIKEVRDSSRWILDDFNLAKKFYERVLPFLPSVWEGRKISCLNERLRFLKYVPGQYFKPHYDGEYERDDLSERSFVTVQIYLNGEDGLVGGETTFLRDRGPWEEKMNAVGPRTGRVVIFEHEILHEGSKIFSGVKYVIRTDVMYARECGTKEEEDRKLKAKHLMEAAHLLEMEHAYAEAISLYKEAKI